MRKPITLKERTNWEKATAGESGTGTALYKPEPDEPQEIKIILQYENGDPRIVVKEIVEVSVDQNIDPKKIQARLDEDSSLYVTYPSDDGSNKFNQLCKLHLQNNAEKKAIELNFEPGCLQIVVPRTEISIQKQRNFAALLDKAFDENGLGLN